MKNNFYKELDFLKDYFVSMNKEKGVLYISLRFNEKWQIFDSNSENEGDFSDENIKVTKHEKEKNLVFFYTNSEDNLPKLFKHIRSVIVYNLELEERLKLLDLKMRELKDIFNETDLSKLKRLDFCFKNNKKVKTKKDDDIV